MSICVRSPFITSETISIGNFQHRNFSNSIDFKIWLVQIVQIIGLTKGDPKASFFKSWWRFLRPQSTEVASWELAMDVELAGGCPVQDGTFFPCYSHLEDGSVRPQTWGWWGRIVRKELGWGEQQRGRPPRPITGRKRRNIQAQNQQPSQALPPYGMPNHIAPTNTTFLRLLHNVEPVKP